MSDIIPFPTQHVPPPASPPASLSHVSIQGGTVTACDKTELIGTYRFFVTLVDLDGLENELWDGAEHDDAKTVAEQLRKDFQLSEVRDLSGRCA